MFVYVRYTVILLYLSMKVHSFYRSAICGKYSLFRKMESYCKSVSSTPITHHIIADRDWSALSSLIHHETNIPIERCKDLIQLGSVYTSPNNLTATTRTNNDDAINHGWYCRVHANPKRYPISSYRWKQRFVVLDNFVVTNKPSGIPTQETLDNSVENMLSVMKKQLDYQSLYITSRLDCCTSGVLILLSSKEEASRINSLLQERQCTKIYKVLTVTPVLPGFYRHLDRNKNKKGKPGLLASYPSTGNFSDFSQLLGWREVSLRVNYYRKLNVNIDGEMTGSPEYLKSIKSVFEHEVELITGRTHQIRRQFAALGASILGDTRYKVVESRLNSIDNPQDATFGIDPPR